IPPGAALGLPAVSAARPSVVIAAPAPVVATLAALIDALGAPVTVVGGWAVTCRLRMARSQARPTEDLDVLLGLAARPARIALEAVAAVQDDPAHPCRLSGSRCWSTSLPRNQPTLWARSRLSRTPTGCSSSSRRSPPCSPGPRARCALPIQLAGPRSLWACRRP